LTPVPTPQDVANAELRASIAARFRAEYAEALALAESAFGPGWEPCGRHYLVDRDEEERARAAGDRARPAATVYTARKDGVKRYFTVADGKPVECPGYQEGFGAMLTEPDPKRGFEKDGRWHAVHRYSLYWAGYEPGYQPLTAEQLAAARERRELRAVEKEAEAHPLFADVIRAEGVSGLGRRKRTGR
jgi:hypothetical protein